MQINNCVNQEQDDSSLFKLSSDLDKCDSIKNHTTKENSLEAIQMTNEYFKKSSVEVQSSDQNWLSVRSDLVNKTLIRSIKKLYLNKFKELNKRIVRKRFVNVEADIIMQALVNFWTLEFAEISYEIDLNFMAEFMMLFLGINSYDDYEFSKEAVAKANQAIDCMKIFTFKKLKKVWEAKEFKILLLKICNSELEEFLSSVKAVKNNKDRYKQAILEMID